MTLSLMHVAIIVLAGVACWFGVKWAFRKDTEIEDRRRKAIDMSARLTQMGFKSMASLFQDYAVGDYSGMFSKMSMVVEKLRGNDRDILADLSDVFDNLLKMKLALKEGRTMVRAELESVERMLSVEAAVAPVPESAVPAPVVPAPVVPALVVPAPVVPPVAPYVLLDGSIPVAPVPAVSAPVAPVQIVVAPAAVVEPPVAPVEPVKAP